MMHHYQTYLITCKMLKQVIYVSNNVLVSVRRYFSLHCKNTKKKVPNERS